MMKLRWLGILTVLLLIGVSAACGPECPEGQQNCGEGDTKLCVNTKTDRAHCGECGKACDSGLVCNDGKCEVSCQKDLTDCSGTCVNTQTDVAHCGKCGEPCKAGQICKGGKCEITCPDGQTACGDICTNTDTDANNCGACDTKCEGGQLCNAGKCELSCVKSQTACGDACVDTQSNYNHCGACDTKCAGGEVCNAGKCETSCQKDLTDCSGSCVNTKTDNAHCGACGTACSAGQICKDGKCEINCADGATDCSGVCANTKTDRANCGACGTACADGEICKDGKCEISCISGQTDCNGKCVDTMSDSANCGACDTKCAAGEVCSAGKCDIFCQKGFDKCGTSCVDLQSNAGNCGKCGDACPAGQVCGAGKCTEACAAGELSCSAGCTNIATDPKNCGACGTACKAGEVCINSQCGACNNCPNWASGAGAFDSDYIRDIAVDGSGNVYAIGYFYTVFKGPAGQQLRSAGSADIFVVKMNPSGRMIWAARAGGSSTDYGYGIDVDSTGNVYISGAFQGSADFGTTQLTSKGSYDIYAAKLDKDGKWQWAKGYGSSSGDYSYDVAVDSNANVYVTGYFYSTTAFGSTSLTSNGGGDVFLLKLDKDGKEQWAGSAGSTSTDYGEAVVVDSKGAVYITGRYYSTISWGTTSLTSTGSSDVFVAKFDGMGAIQWAATAGGTGIDYSYALAVDANGNVAVTGGFSSSGADFGTTKLTSAGSYDVFVAHLDDKGKWTWAVSGGGSSSDYGHGVGIDSTGVVWATGYLVSDSASFGGLNIKLPSTSNEAYLLQIDKTGKIIGAMGLGGTGSDYAYDLVVDSNDNIYVGGYGSNLLTFGKVELITNGGADGFVAKWAARTTPVCPGANSTICNNACTDTQNDEKNCGSCSTLCSAGQLCGAGKCVSPPTGIFIEEYSTGTPDYAVLKNYGTTDVNLAGLYFYLNWDSDWEDYDTNEPLPNYTLKAGDKVYLIESGGTAQTGDIQLKNSLITLASDDLVVLLCFGICEKGTATNVLDALHVGSGPPLPTGITFFPNSLSTKTTSTDSSYLRKATAGKTPTFAAADWQVGPSTR